jgi:hypothetical protein
MLLITNLLDLALRKEYKYLRHIFKLPTIKGGHVGAVGWDYDELLVLNL